MAEPATQSASGDGQIPLRQRPLPDRIEYFVDKLGDQLGVEGLPRDTVIAIGAAVINLGAVAAELRERHELQWATRVQGEASIPDRYYPDDETTCRKRAARRYGEPHQLVQRDVYPTPWRAVSEEGGGGA